MTQQPHVQGSQDAGVCAHVSMPSIAADVAVKNML